MDTEIILDEEESTDGLTLARYAERAYLDYAISTIRSRALPDVSDGQKPVQRRILFAMHEMGLGPAAKPVKSARVVGDVLGKYHPHGDSAAYDAMVRMAQDFSLRYPLVDGQGNFGSRDGDGAAAMRYTEARLTQYARLLLDEIDQGTVEFVPNYDGSATEPELLPARLPMILLNGASGIAVAMATEIPSHNLVEVAQAAIALIRDPKLSHEALMQIMPGPDFPGGGQIISSSADLAEAYRSGRGSIRVRARYHIEELARGQWQLVVDELPHGVSSQKVLEEVEELSNPKVRSGKKALTPEQLQAKSQILNVMDAVRDESGREAAVRLVFEPKTSRIEQALLVNTLLACTSLETSVSINLVMLGQDKRPRQKTLTEILQEWIDFRLHTVRRRSAHRLGKVEDRIHILEGRQLVLLNIDEVIRIIRESDEPKPALMQAFGLTERQAEDILEIRLRQLARLEAIRIEQELKELFDERKKLQGLLGSEATLKKAVIKEIEADIKTYGDDRRTLIEAAEKAAVEARQVEEPVTVIISAKGWVRSRQGHGHDARQFNFKTGDELAGAYEVKTTDQLHALASNGRVYSIPVAGLPSARGDGVPVTSFVELEAGSQILHAFAAPADAGVLLATEKGFGLTCVAGDWQSRMKAGKHFLTLEEGDVPLPPVLFDASRTDATVVCLSDGQGGGDKGRVLAYPVSEVKTLHKGGRGVTLMGLEKKEKLRQVIVAADTGLVVTGTGRMAKPQSRTMSTREIAANTGTRGRKGKQLDPRWKDVRLWLPGTEPAA
ncbi:DNA topoisomerase IV subunit A [Lautropia mirabilis ATCC 51599]|uniref:DNA topoisomerase 4 subunit A n=1 Tax=Lautropia mirabilis ATCC 51599 TaxID=887898 RepID=E7RVD5_9BURK|nr:DNA topoisomerase IV subunit A [Lautropia mirabilis]EFV95739.1 DNA topoisomerase IV, A subunit [Lautropia mirabilis ATCC 51599]VEH02805.1 DNA topoisomerase 4 subunit A [Lautropia mirabilis]